MPQTLHVVQIASGFRGKIFAAIVLWFHDQLSSGPSVYIRIRLNLTSSNILIIQTPLRNLVNLQRLVTMCIISNLENPTERQILRLPSHTPNIVWVCNYL